MPLVEYKCEGCSKTSEHLYSHPIPTRIMCPFCKDEDGTGNEAVRQISAHGGYSMSSGGSSTRPRGAGSFKKGKK